MSFTTFCIMSSEAALLLETVQFAAEKHRNQRRKDQEGTPYINHPIGMLMPCQCRMTPSGAVRKSGQSLTVEVLFIYLFIFGIF